MTDVLARRTHASSTPQLPAVPSVPAPRRGDAHLVTLAAFVVATFVGAALVFFLEPMAVKMLLPAFGGSAAVWNTAMVFFQAALLGGYAYAYALGRARRLRRVALAHAVAVVGVVLALPPHIDATTAGAWGSTPLLGVVVLLALGIGAPFLVIACAGPLLQRWFAASAHPRRHDPYFLYAAGNLGSLAGLLLYPLVVEPRLTLTQQAAVLRYGLLAFAVASVLCAAAVGRRGEAAQAELASAPAPVFWRRRLWWMLLAAVPSALMLGATNHVATDIASFPLLWVLPLGLYLGSFVVAFGAGSERAARVSGALLPVCGIAVAITAVGGLQQLPGIQVLAHWSLLFCAATACHSRLAADRPAAGSLTTFYLCLSTGGAVGGLLVGIVAPLVLESVIEYPVAIVAAMVLGGGFAKGRPARLPRAAVLAAALLAAGAILLLNPTGVGAAIGIAVALLPLLVLGLRRPVVMVVAVAFVALSLHGSIGVMHADRTFYGVHRLTQSVDGMHVLKSGTTVHGLQRVGAADEGEPLGYYHRESPVGEVMRWASADRGVTDVAVVGLGAGSLAAYAQPHQQWTFYDIDASVVETATNPRYFTHITSSAAARTTIEIADGRLGVAQLPDDSVDMLVLDAFTSDAIPVHLLTREAFALYGAKLRDDGIVVVHISNRYLDLEAILGATARTAGLHGQVWADRDATDDAHFPSHWAVLAGSPHALDRLNLARHWRVLPDDGRVWTDDFSDVWSAIRWG